MKKKIFKYLMLFVIVNVILLMPFWLEAGESNPTSITSFTLPTLAEGDFIFNPSSGQQVTVINFWASWCKPCRKEVPELNAMQEKYAGQNILFLGINAGEKTNLVQKFVKYTGFEFKILLDSENKVSDVNKIFSLPRTLVISKSGQVLYNDSEPPKDLGFSLK